MGSEILYCIVLIHLYGCAFTRCDFFCYFIDYHRPGSFGPRRVVESTQKCAGVLWSEACRHDSDQMTPAGDRHSLIARFFRLTEQVFSSRAFKFILAFHIFIMFRDIVIVFLFPLRWLYSFARILAMQCVSFLSQSVANVSHFVAKCSNCLAIFK